MKKFEHTCAWANGALVIDIEDYMTAENVEKQTKNDLCVYGKDIHTLLNNAEIGEVVEWEEPFNGWVKAKRIS